jgi:hypothetical protein
MVKREVLFGIDSYFQLMTAINLRTTVYKDWCADIIIYGSVPSADVIANRVRETGMFGHVYLAFTSLALCGNKYTWREKLPKYFVYLYSLFSPKQVVKNAIGAKLEKSYDEFVMNGFGALPDAIFNACYRVNKNIGIKRIEDGYVSYFTEFGSKKGKARRMLEWMAQKLLGYENIKDYIVGYYFVEPELVTAHLSYPVFRSPKFSRENKELVRVLNHVFGYDDSVKLRKKIYLFEDGSLFFMNSDEEIDIVKELKEVVNTDDFIVKMHPRRKENRFEALGVDVMEKSSIPWEVIQLNNRFDNCIFMTVASSVAFSSDIYFGDKCHKILFYKCLKNPPKLINGNFMNYLQLYKEKFGEDSLHIPSSYAELKETIIKCYK